MAIQKQIRRGRIFSGLPNPGNNINRTEVIVLARWDDSDLENDVEFVVGLVLANTSTTAIATYEADLRAQYRGAAAYFTRGNTSGISVREALPANSFEIIFLECDPSGTRTYQGFNLGSSYNASSFDSLLSEPRLTESSVFSFAGSISQASWNAQSFIELDERMGSGFLDLSLVGIGDFTPPAPPVPTVSYKDVYNPTGTIAAPATSYKDVYSPTGQVVGYNDVYNPAGQIGAPVSPYKDVYNPTGTIASEWVMYMIESGTSFPRVYSINLDNGVATRVATLVTQFREILCAASDGSKIYAVLGASSLESNRFLATIDIENWTITKVADISITPNAMTWDGKQLVVGAGYQLYSVDRSDASVTLIGPTGGTARGETNITGVAFDFLNYFVVGTGSDALYRMGSHNNYEPQRLGTAFRFNVNEVWPYGLAVDPGNLLSPLYMLGALQGAIFTLDVNRGIATRLGNQPNFGLPSNPRPNTIFFAPTPGPSYKDAYNPVGQIGGWNDVYNPKGELAGYRDIYNPTGIIPDQYRDVYNPVGTLINYTDVYNPVGKLDGYRDVYNPVGQVDTYRDVYNPTGRLAEYKDVYNPTGIISAGSILDVGGNNIFDDLLQASVRIGRSEAAHLARVLPMQMQLIVDNKEGKYGPDKLIPQTKVAFTWENDLIASGWITDVQSSKDHTKGLDTTVIRVEGSLARLAKSLYELSLFATNTNRTDQIINDALDQVGWPDNDREISLGQIRIHAAHYTRVLAGRRIQRAGPVIRATEEAEVGLVHEGRGDKVVFEHRLFRELDTSQPWVLGPDDVEKIVTPQENWDNVYTNIQVGAERATVQAERKIWESDLNLSSPRAGVSFVIDINDPSFAFGLENDAVRSVIEWSPLESEHYDGTATISLTNRTRTRTTVNFLTAGTLTRLELHGRGIGLYGNLVIPEFPDDEAVKLYGRRTLILPVSFVGDGLNTEGDAIEEGRAYAELLLWRYSRPPLHGRVPLNPKHHRPLVKFVSVSDRVQMKEGTGMPPGDYHVEGWDFLFDANGSVEMGLQVSRRGERNVLANRVAVSTSGENWATVDSITVEGDSLRAFALYCRQDEATISEEAEEYPVVRLLRGNELVRSWTRVDIIEDAVTQPLAGIAREAGTYTFQTRSQGTNQILTDRFQTVEMVR